MQTKHLCVLIHIWVQDEVGAVKPVKYFYWLFQDATSFVDHLHFFVSCVSCAFASVHCCLLVTCWERADLLALVGDVYCNFVIFPCGILCQVWYLIVSFPDLCRLSYFAPLQWGYIFPQLKGRLLKKDIFHKLCLFKMRTFLKRRNLNAPTVSKFFPLREVPYE